MFWDRPTRIIWTFTKPRGARHNDSEFWPFLSSDLFATVNIALHYSFWVPARMAVSSMVLINSGHQPYVISRRGPRSHALALHCDATNLLWM